MYETIVLSTSIAAALVTHELNVHRKFGSVSASATVALIFSLVFYLLPKSGVTLIIPPVAMGASFVAMSSERVIPNRRWMSVAGAVFGIVFLTTSPSLEGYGGVLGTGACVSVLMTIGMVRFYKFSIRVVRNL